MGLYLYSFRRSGECTSLYSRRWENPGWRSILNITQNTSYPENGKINFTVQSDSDREIGLAFRIPGWAEHYTLRLDGKEITPDQVENGYALISRCWKNAAYIELEFDMQPRFICANRRNSFMIWAELRSCGGL